MSLLKLQINENGVLSLDSPIFNIQIEEFGTFNSFTSLVAPLWTDLDLTRFGGGILYRLIVDSNSTIFEQAGEIVRQQFSMEDFEPTTVLIVTWFEIGHLTLGDNVRVNCECETHVRSTCENVHCYKQVSSLLKSPRLVSIALAGHLSINRSQGDHYRQYYIIRMIAVIIVSDCGRHW